MEESICILHLQALEVGMDGVVLHTDNLAEIGLLRVCVHNRNPCPPNLVPITEG